MTKPTQQSRLVQSNISSKILDGTKFHLSTWFESGYKNKYIMQLRYTDSIKLVT